MESPAATLRRHQTEVRRLLRGGFTKCAKLRTAHAAWRDEGRGARTRIPPARRGFPHRRRTLRGAPSTLRSPRPPPDLSRSTRRAHGPGQRRALERPRTDAPAPRARGRPPERASPGDARAPRCSSFPSPRRLTPFPPAPSNRSQLEARVLAKRRATLAAALRRVGAVLLEAEDDDPGSHLRQSQSLSPEEKKKSGSGFGSGSSPSPPSPFLSPSSPFPPALLRARAVAAARASALADARRAVRELSATLADESVSALARTAPAFEAATPGAMRDAMAFALDRVERDGAEKSATLRIIEEGLRPRRSRGSAEKVGSEGSDGAEGAPSPELTRETLTTLVATWILSPTLENEAVEEAMTLLEAETRT